MLKHVQPGEVFHPSATRENAFVDAALWFARQGHRSTTNAESSRPDDATLIEVINKTGADVQQWGIVKIGDPAVLPTDNQSEFEESNLFEGDLPTDVVGDIHVIVKQALAADEIGVAVLSGVSSVQVDVIDSAHNYATTIDTDSSKLESADFGQFRILWKESGTGLKWAKVFKEVNVCATINAYPIDILVDGNNDYVIGLKNDGAGNYSCVRVLAEEC